MLVGGSRFARHRVAFLLGATALVALPAAGWYVAARAGWLAWPEGSGTVGLTLGLLAAGIIAFEMLIWPRKKFRRYRLGRARIWMAWHVWLGLASLPLAVCHSGFQFGGVVTTWVLALFLTVIASGIWGLAMQQVLPRKLLDDFPTETIETEVDAVMAYAVDEASHWVETAATGETSDPLRPFFRDEIEPYLRTGPASRSLLRSAARAGLVFDDLAARHAGAAVAVRRLQALCDQRRRYDAQARIHWWLHNWLCIHLPLSVALCVVLVVHIVTALKYW